MIDAIIVSLLSLCIVILIVLISVNVFQGYLISEEAEDAESGWYYWERWDNPSVIAATVKPVPPADGQMWQRISEQQFWEKPYA